MSVTASPNTPSGEKDIYAEVIRIPYMHRAYSALRLLYVFLVSENPITWGFRQGKQNPQADLEGIFLLQLLKGLLTKYLFSTRALFHPICSKEANFRK